MLSDGSRAVAADVLAFFVAAIWPAWDYFDTRRLRAASNASARVRYYRQLVVLLWMSAVAACIISAPATLLTTTGLGLDTHWLADHRWMQWLLWTIGALFMMVQVVLPAWQGAVKYRSRSTLEPPQMEWLRFFLPASRSERRWFAVLAISAGVCEEIVCRGFLLRYLHTFPFNLGFATAVLASVVVFGIHHVYQGVRGIIGSTVTGLIFVGLLLATGSLWVPILCHSLMILSVLTYWRARSLSS